VLAWEILFAAQEFFVAGKNLNLVYFILMSWDDV
jgi:hypothetical protein